MKLTTNWRSSMGRLSLAAAVVFGSLGMLFAEERDRSAPKAANRYIGAAKCKNCHQSEGSGDQYGAWNGAKHAQAFDVLASDAAKALASGLGIDDPQKSDQCLKCHTTAFGEPAEMIKKGFKIEHGVQCESCHGPGEQHMKARFAAAAEEEEEEGFGDEDALPFVALPDGEVISNPPMETCYACHNKENPTFKRFCYYEFVEQVRHLDPRKPRTEEQRAAMLVCGCDDPCQCVDKCPDDGCGVPPEK